MKRIRWVLWMLLLLLSCSLASCKPKAEEPPITEIPVQEVPEELDPKIVMSTQYYDSIGNYIEIPMLVMPDEGEANEAISAINLALAEIQEQYQVIPDVIASNQQCIFYPTETDRYINLLLFRTRFFTDLNTGHTVSFVYDKKENRQVTMEDALALVGLTEQDLFHTLSAQYDPGYAQNYPNANICIQNHALEAFRLNRDDQPIFYLTARTDDADDTVQDAVSGANRLYIWADGVFTVYEQYNIGEEYSVGRIDPLVPAEETVTMETPLWNQWYFSGDEPDGGFTVIPSPERTPSDVPLTYDIGKTLNELKNEYPEGEFLVSLDGFPDSAAACFGKQGAEYVYFFFGGHDGDFEKAMDECEDQLKCAGFITTANILFPDMEDDMSFEDFFSLIGVHDYEYFGEDTITAEGWLSFTYRGMNVMVNTNEAIAGGGWEVTEAEIVKRNAPVSIVDPEILNTNQNLAEAIMFDGTALCINI